MANRYVVQETNGTLSVEPGMKVSELKHAAKAAGARVIDRSPDRVLVGTSSPVLAGVEVFLLRNARIYARKWHQTEFPN
ncbi:MAG TPA: hypothetical protein VG206_10740 [Terriglobia bacterium]|nr:hypothetical protein [Terriglobia bacterium]